MERSRVQLGKLNKGARGLILQVGIPGSPTDLIQRLMDMGVLEGSTFEIVHEAPFGKDPVAIRIRGALIALRRSEANLVEVEIRD